MWKTFIILLLFALIISFLSRGVGDILKISSPYGASTIKGLGGVRMPSANELKLAKVLDRHINKIARKLLA